MVGLFFSPPKKYNCCEWPGSQSTSIWLIVYKPHKPPTMSCYPFSSIWAGEMRVLGFQTSRGLIVLWDFHLAPAFVQIILHSRILDSANTRWMLQVSRDSNLKPAGSTGGRLRVWDAERALRGMTNDRLHLVSSTKLARVSPCSCREAHTVKSVLCLLEPSASAFSEMIPHNHQCFLLKVLFQNYLIITFLRPLRRDITVASLTCWNI